MSSPAANVAVYLALCVGLTAVPAALGFGWRCYRRYADRAAAIRPTTIGPPLERIAADLRRIERCARALPTGCPFARRRGVELAFDDVLVVACRALQIPTRLTELPMGWERDVERLRVEACLGNAGLNVRS